jgi:hypothetical protein
MEDQGLNPMELKTGSAYLEYILNSEGEILWMHFDEAQRIESSGKDEAFDDGFQAGYMQATKMMEAKLNEIKTQTDEPSPKQTCKQT